MFLKCKMCGGDLNIDKGATTCKCEYCGTIQTIPVLDDEKKNKLFERANRLRFNNEFDKAYSVYHDIINDFPTEAEAYWGLLLCKYGIEYVEDPYTHKRIPTCHRSSFESIFDDDTFEMVMENADVVAREIYRNEAKAIEELRKKIIEVSNKEEPYDIFICYKEADEQNNRTIDSVIAQDVYNALTEKGYRVFFSRISLEDKLGQEYEPYIFAALNSAKVMLVFGTKYDYFNAVWVKNEWSRYLQLIAKGEKKTLIPCYRDIDAYDMPKEFQHLQAQDMGKVGAIQDLLRGIEKVMPKQEKTVVKETVADHVETVKKIETPVEEKPVEKQKKSSLALILFIVACIVVAALVPTVIIPKYKYNKAMDLLESGSYEAAYAILEEIGNVEAIASNKYDRAIALLESGDFEKAYALLEEIGNVEAIASNMYDRAVASINTRDYETAYMLLNGLDYKDSADLLDSILPEYQRLLISRAEVGSYVSFGSYEQDNNTANGQEEIEWLVLSKEGGLIWLVSRYALDCKPFNYSLTDVTWETCSLRSWLNDSFYHNAFDSTEQQIIASKYVSADRNPDYAVSSGNSTTDKVFLLSVSEVNRYLGSNSARTCSGTDYAYAQGAYKSNAGNCWWWLRTHGGSSSYAVNVWDYGAIDSYGGWVDNNKCGIRPAICIEMGY